MLMRDIGTYLKPLSSLVTTTADSEQSGVFVDTQPTADGRYNSAAILVAWQGVLAQAETLTLAFNVQDNAAASADGNEADYGGAFASAVVATGGSGGSTERGVSKLNIDLKSARKYLRVQATATTSSTGTVNVMGLVVLGGAQVLPAA